MRIRYILLMSLLLVSLALAGCGTTAEPTVALTVAAAQDEPTATIAPDEPTATTAPADASTALSGTLSLAGSTTVQPLAEVLGEAFMEMNPDLVIEVQGGGSSVGVTSAGEGTANIGMASRAIKDSELETFPDLHPAGNLAA